MQALFVAHRRHDGAPTAAHWPPGRGLRVETCLRRVWFGTTPAVRGADDEVEHYAGAEAYRFLLEFTTGLHSAIPGETNVFGQFRQAWSRWQAAAPAAAAELADIVNALLIDTRRIRARHLQGVGGTSYGSLLRRLIRPGRTDNVLIVGAGELARSLWPFFRQHTTGAWNRHDLAGRLPAWIRTFGPDAGAHAAQWAHHVVLTTPPDPLNDGRWRSWLEHGAPRTVTHLGHHLAGQFNVSTALQSFWLDDLFALRRSQANVRSLQVERARAACRARATQRAHLFTAAPARARA